MTPMFDSDQHLGSAQLARVSGSTWRTDVERLGAPVQRNCVDLGEVVGQHMLDTTVLIVCHTVVL
jgi:hypothetical protein